MRRLIIALSVLLMVVLAGCDSGSGDDGENAAYTDAVIANLEGRDDVPLTDDELECFATRVVESVGASTFEDAGLEPEDVGNAEVGDLELELSDEQVAAIGGVFEACDLSVGEALSRMGGTFDASTISCIEANVEADALAAVAGEFLLKGELTDIPPELAPAVACLG